MRHYVGVVLVVCLVMVACSVNNAVFHLPDAQPPPEDGPHGDAGGLDAAVLTGPVTLTVTRNGAPIAGVHTYFLNADSSVVATRDTDDTGVASAVMAAGGSVTAIDPFPQVNNGSIASGVTVGDNDLRTFMGVKPGDHLVLTENEPPGTPITFTLNAKAYLSANTYDVKTSCGSGSILPGGGNGGEGGPDPSGQVTLFDCHDTTDILILASEGSDNGPVLVGALYHPNVALTDGGTVDLSGDAFQPIADVTFSYTNVPAAVGFISVERVLATARGALSGLTFFGGDSPDGNGSMTVDFQEPAITDATSIVDMSVEMNGLHHVIDRAVATTYMLDMTGVLLPDLHGQPFYQPSTRRMLWIEETTGATPDFTTVSIDVFRDERHWRWAVAAPHAPEAEFTFPMLPTDVADWTPSSSDGIDVHTLMNAQVPGGYDAVRARIHDVQDVTEFASAMGRVVTVETIFRGGGINKPSRKLRARKR